jgi:hypothetical protein
MSKSDSSNPNGGPSFQAPRYRPNWLAAILCFIVATYLFAALLNYDPNQTRFQSTAPTGKNWVGWLGADTVWVLFYTLGVSTWLLVPAFYWMFYVAVRNSRHLVATRVTAIVIGIVSMSGLLAMFESVKPNDTFPKAWGGLTGQIIYQRMLAEALGPFGTGLLLGTDLLLRAPVRHHQGHRLRDREDHRQLLPVARRPGPEEGRAQGGARQAQGGDGQAALRRHGRAAPAGAAVDSRGADGRPEDGDAEGGGGAARSRSRSSSPRSRRRPRSSCRSPLTRATSFPR